MCKQGISCSNSADLTQLLNEQHKFKQHVEEKAKKRADYDKIEQDEKFNRAGNPYRGDLLTYAMDVLSYY